MVITANDALTQLVIFAGVIIGNAGATIVPYIRSKADYANFDIQIFFKKEFIGVAAGAFVSAFIMVSGSFNSFLAQILAGNPATYAAAFIAAAGLGFTLNTIGNWLLPSPTNPKESKLKRERIAAQVLNEKGIDLERLSNMGNVTFENGSMNNDKEGSVIK